MHDAWDIRNICDRSTVSSSDHTAQQQQPNRMRAGNKRTEESHAKTRQLCNSTVQEIRGKSSTKVVAQSSFTVQDFPSDKVSSVLYIR